MGLSYFVNEVQEQSNVAVKLANEYIQHAGTLKDSVNHFLNAPLSSKTYDSARNYFRVVYPPLSNALTLAAESLNEAHTKYPAMYQSLVGGGDTEEDCLLDQIQQGKQLRDSYLEVLNKLEKPNQRMEQACMRVQACIDKLQERLDKFYHFNSESAGIFSEAEANIANLEAAIAALGKGGAWNASSGTFDISRLDMTWAKPVQIKWKERQQRLAEKRKVLVTDILPGNLKELHENYYWSTAHNAYVSKKTCLPVHEISKLAYQFAQSDPESFKHPLLDYYNKLISTGIDPLTGRKLSAAEIANAKIMRTAIAVQPIYYAAIVATGQPYAEKYVDDLNKMDDYLDVDGKVNLKIKLRGEMYTIDDVGMEPIIYTKRTTAEKNQMRRSFDSSIRKNFLKQLGDNTDTLKAAGFSDADISKIKGGNPPTGWEVHHQLPLDDSGTNDFSNLILIKLEHEHKVITNYQRYTTKGMKPGDSIEMSWPFIDSSVYPIKSK